MTYEILDGVRRSKAAEIRGHVTIKSMLFDSTGSRFLRDIEVATADLLSPKAVILRCTQHDDDRWLSAYRGAAADPLPFPPIYVREGTRGCPLSSVIFDFGSFP